MPQLRENLESVSENRAAQALIRHFASEIVDGREAQNPIARQFSRKALSRARSTAAVLAAASPRFNFYPASEIRRLCFQSGFLLAKIAVPQALNLGSSWTPTLFKPPRKCITAHHRQASGLCIHTARGRGRYQ